MSGAGNLVPLGPGDPFSGEDAFVHDLRTGKTVLASRADGADGRVARSGADDPSIAPDGRSVSFTSASTNLTRERTGYWNDVFVRDPEQHRTTLVSRASGWNGAAGDSSSTDNAISAGGRVVAFDSRATNLARNDARVDDVFVRDTRRHRTVLVSRANGARGHVSHWDSYLNAISPSGRYVAFASEAPDLTAGDTTEGFEGQDLFVRDLRNQRTALVSRAAGQSGAGGDHNSAGAEISDDGRRVAFTSLADNLSGDDRTPAEYHPGGEPDPIYGSNGYWTGNDVYLRDTAAATTTLVSRAGSGEAADADSFLVGMSADGRYVAFASRAGNIVPRAKRDAAGIFVADLAHGGTVLATVPRTNGEAVDAALSRDGRFLAFVSGSDVQVRDLRTGRTVNITRRSCARR